MAFINERMRLSTTKSNSNLINENMFPFNQFTNDIKYPRCIRYPDVDPKTIRCKC